ncbi:MICOS complex subunit MIC25 isoform X1 [Crocuta crocuta]
MGSTESSEARRVSFGMDEEERVRVLQGIRLSENVVNRMKDPSQPCKAGGPAPSPAPPPSTRGTSEGPQKGQGAGEPGGRAEAAGRLLQGAAGTHREEECGHVSAVFTAVPRGSFKNGGRHKAPQGGARVLGAAGPDPSLLPRPPAGSAAVLGPGQGLPALRERRPQGLRSPGSWPGSDSELSRRDHRPQTPGPWRFLPAPARPLCLRPPRLWEMEGVRLCGNK